VADNGIGITPDILSRVFEPYFTTKEVDEGTGLGLSVTMGIVQSHNGLIEVSSTPGVGTIFSIYLPELQEQKSVISKTAVTGHTGNGERVLVLDDEDFFVSIMRDYLIHMNYQPSVFRDPLEALAELRQHGSDYDLVVTDLSMPGLSGIEFISEIKKMGIDIPIMLCTGFSDKITEETAQYYGITKFLLKPVSKTDIENALFEVFKKEGS
jgi:CheY-like chemotaxis protein